MATLDKVAFTGSTEVGKLIVAAAPPPNLEQLPGTGWLQLNIVFDYADPAAVEGAANAIFFNDRQRRVAGSRLFVQQSRFDEVPTTVSPRSPSRSRWAPGWSQGRKMACWAPTSSSAGSPATWNPASPTAPPPWQAAAGSATAATSWQPTVLTNTTPDMKVVREEILGPVLVASPFTDLGRDRRRRQRQRVRPRRRDSRKSGTSPRHTPWPRNSGPYGLDQLLQRVRRSPRHSAATSSPAGAAKWATKH